MRITLILSVGGLVLWFLLSIIIGEPEVASPNQLDKSNYKENKAASLVDIINDKVTQANDKSLDRQPAKEKKRSEIYEEVIEEEISSWGTGVNPDDIFTDESYVDALSRVDPHTQIFGYPLKINQNDLRNLKPGDVFAVDIPHTGIKYTTEVVEVGANGDIVSIHADLLRQEGEYDYSYDWGLEVMALTLGGSGSGEGAIFTNNGTYDIKVYGNYSWITDHQTRPPVRTD